MKHTIFAVVGVIVLMGSLTWIFPVPKPKPSVADQLIDIFNKLPVSSLSFPLAATNGDCLYITVTRVRGTNGLSAMQSVELYKNVERILREHR